MLCYGLDRVHDCHRLFLVGLGLVQWLAPIVRGRWDGGLLHKSCVGVPDLCFSWVEGRLLPSCSGLSRASGASWSSSSEGGTTVSPSTELLCPWTFEVTGTCIVFLSAIGYAIYQVIFDRTRESIGVHDVGTINVFMGVMGVMNCCLLWPLIFVIARPS